MARAHWPASPCAGREQLTWVTAAPMEDFAATAHVEQCAVTISWNAVADADPSPGFLCTVLEHEFGHLAGLGHSDDSNNVMFPTIWKTAPDCAAAFPAQAKLRRAGIPSTHPRSRRVATTTQRRR